MCRLYKVAPSFILFLASSLAIQHSVHASSVPIQEPEDSPLFAQSARQAFGLMEARAHPVAAPLKTSTPAVILVAGTHWYSASEMPSGLASPRKPLPADPHPGTPVPRDLTTDITCDVTCGTSCMFTSCGATCDATPTCRGYLSCHVPMPTCYNFSCGPGATCSGSLTCAGYPTCDYQTTCMYSPTCDIMQPTCAGSSTCTQPTCQGTCIPAACQTTLFGITVPAPGQIQFSFNSSAVLAYTLQYSTNLSSTQWVNALSTNGTGAILSLRHTNNAPMALYRLLIQNP